MRLSDNLFILLDKYRMNMLVLFTHRLIFQRWQIFATVLSEHTCEFLKLLFTDILRDQRGVLTDSYRRMSTRALLRLVRNALIYIVPTSCGNHLLIHVLL